MLVMSWVYKTTCFFLVLSLVRLSYLSNTIIIEYIKGKCLALNRPVHTME